MLLRAAITNYQNVDVSENEITKAAYKIMLKKLNFPEGGYIEDGVLKESWEEHGGSHSWSESTVVREATEDDVAICKVINMLGWWR